MKFIAKHTKEPWTVNNCGPHWNNQSIDNLAIHYGSDGEHIVDHVYERPDADLIAHAPAMLNYMIERAEWLSRQTQINDSQFNDGWKSKKEELSRILGIINAAGVEVVE